MRLSWSEKILSYCERGGNPSFWAEPANAVSNAAFILAALTAAVQLARRERNEGPRTEEWLLIMIVVAIGIGSFLFHTLATRWASIADVAPIGLFMLAYLGYALRRFAGLGWPWVGLALGLLVVSLRYAGEIGCGPGLLPITAAARGRCLNGTLGYAPAFLALLAVGGWLAALRHPAWRWLLAACAVFLLSMAARTIDLEVCRMARIGGRVLGTHWLWHLLNAATLYILLAAAVRHGGTSRRDPTAKTVQG